MRLGLRMRKPALVAVALSLVLSAPVEAENLIGVAAVLRALDKVTATTQDYTVPVGETLEYGSLDIKVHHCEKKRPEEIPEIYVFLQVFERSQTKDSAKLRETVEPDDSKLFSGWMFASSPALSALEHPVYDVWVLDCMVPEVEEDYTNLQ